VTHGRRHHPGAGQLGFESNDNIASQACIRLDSTRATGTNGRGTLALASKGTKDTTDQAVTGSWHGSSVLACQVTMNTKATVATKESESAAFELVNILDRCCGGDSDESCETESVVNHVVEIWCCNVFVEDNYANRLTSVIVVVVEGKKRMVSNQKSRS
jgi:hypothetical protein